MRGIHITGNTLFFLHSVSPLSSLLALGMVSMLQRQQLCPERGGGTTDGVEMGVGVLVCASPSQSIGQPKGQAKGGGGGGGGGEDGNGRYPCGSLAEYTPSRTIKPASESRLQRMRPCCDSSGS